MDVAWTIVPGQRAVHCFAASWSVLGEEFSISLSANPSEYWVLLNGDPPPPAPPTDMLVRASAVGAALGVEAHRHSHLEAFIETRHK